MTTSHFAALVGPTARAMAHVRALHCRPPTFRPAETASGSMRCTKCGGTLRFKASVTGKTSGKCSSAGCINWAD